MIHHGSEQDETNISKESTNPLGSVKKEKRATNS